jgi:hypothetical protein
MSTRCLRISFGLLIAVFVGQRLSADTIASTVVRISAGSADNDYNFCPGPGVCEVSGGGGYGGPTILQSQVSGGGQSAKAVVNLTTGSVGVMTSGGYFSSASANFSNEFFCTASSPCASIGDGGVPALLSFSLTGTITPPFLDESPSLSDGGFLEVQFSYDENDIGGGSSNFSFETGYDDTLDGPPTARVSVNGITHYPDLTYATQPDGTVKVALNWTQPFTICPYGCAGFALLSYQTGPGAPDESLFGTSTSARITLDGYGPLAGANFVDTFSTTITSLDPNYSFFSDTGPTSPSSTPEPSSWILFSIALGLLVLRISTRRVRSHER